MCPPGCYHNGFIATPELGHRMYGYTLLDCIVESQECSNCKQWAKQYAIHIYFTYIHRYFIWCLVHGTLTVFQINLTSHVITQLWIYVAYLVEYLASPYYRTGKYTQYFHFRFSPCRQATVCVYSLLTFVSVHKFWNLCHLAKLFGKAFLIFVREIHPKISMVANETI